MHLALISLPVLSVGLNFLIVKTNFPIPTTGININYSVPLPIYFSFSCSIEIVNVYFEALVFTPQVSSSKSKIS